MGSLLKTLTKVTLGLLKLGAQVSYEAEVASLSAFARRAFFLAPLFR